ncbi:MAG TPA: hypothetical protein PKD85_05220 [Saprospiraceae bacterium]|nr:hypothetical protein [Saprospiraceae bacterium]
MKNILQTSLLFYLILCCQVSNAQINNKAIYAKKTFWGFTHYGDGKKISKSQLEILYYPKDEVYNLYQKGRNNRMFANLLGFVGGFALGRTLAVDMSESGKRTGYIISAVGIGSGLILASHGNNQILDAAKLYNKSLNGLSKNTMCIWEL